MRKDNARKTETPRARKNGSVKPKINNSEKKKRKMKSWRNRWQRKQKTWKRRKMFIPAKNPKNTDERKDKTISDNAQKGHS